MASLPFLAPLEPPSLPTPMASSSSSLLRGLPFLRRRLHLHRHGLTAASRLTQPRWPLWTTAGEPAAADAGAASSSEEISAVKEAPKYSRWNDPDYRQWRDKEDEIFKDIEPIFLLAKDILHSSRYMDGEHLKPEDMKAVVEKLLVYHPHSDDKVGCGLDSIMVDRHPEFKQSRCLFLIRTDGAWIDFSYQKCLRQYIREKYPSHAERFIREHFKRGS